jgi:hypothetical protein
VRIANDRRNLLTNAKHSEEANDHYIYSDRSLSHRATIGARAPHLTYTHSCTSTIDRTPSTIERTCIRGSCDLLIGHFSPFSHHLVPLHRRSIGCSTLHTTVFAHSTLHSSPTINHNHHRPSKTSHKPLHSRPLHHIFVSHHSIIPNFQNPNPSHFLCYTLCFDSCNLLKQIVDVLCVCGFSFAGGWKIFWGYCSSLRSKAAHHLFDSSPEPHSRCLKPLILPLKLSSRA